MNFLSLVLLIDMQGTKRIQLKIAQKPMYVLYAREIKIDDLEMK